MDKRSGPDGGSARLSFGFAAALFLHALIIGGGFVWGLLQKPPEPAPEPIAVELVEEPPAPKPEEPVAAEPQEAKESAQEPPPPPEETAVLPPTDPIDLAPAFDAAKSAQSDEATTVGDKGAADLAVIAAVDQPQPSPTDKPSVESQTPDQPQEAAKAEAQPAPQETAQEAPPVEPLPPAPEGAPALSEPSPKPEAEKAETGNPETVDPKRFAFFAPVPKMEFESGAKASQSAKGNAIDSYTSRLYGMIMPLVRVPNLPRNARPRPMQVDFVVDGRGRLSGAAVMQSSGVPSLDVAVLYALRQAAPFPPTPEGKPIRLTLDYALE